MANKISSKVSRASNAFNNAFNRLTNLDSDLNNRAEQPDEKFRHLSSVLAGDEYKKYEEKEGKKALAKIAAIGFAVLLFSGVGMNKISEHQQPPETSAPREVPQPQAAVPTEGLDYPVQQGDTASELALVRTPRGQNPSELQAYIEEEARDDGSNGLHPYDFNTGSGDIIDNIGPPLPPNDDANPYNNVPMSDNTIPTTRLMNHDS